MILYLETSGSGLKRSSLELLTAARSVATGNTIVGLLINAESNHVTQAAEYGLTECVSLTGEGVASFSNDVVSALIADVAKERQAATVLFAANATGKDLAPRTAALLDAALLPDCIALSGKSGSIEVTRPVFAGKALQHLRSKTPTTVVTLRPNVFTAKKTDTPTQPTTSDRAVPVSSKRSSVVTGVSRNEGSLDVAEADIIVSGGRGLKGPEHFTLVEELAKALGGAVGASRAVVDAGWRPHTEQVGQTGKTVSPSMYIACGISGAVQHLAGMSSSKIIVAINKDKDAPIFKVADYGIVGDVFDVLPKLTAQINTVVQKH